jgi:hypothetical protein
MKCEYGLWNGAEHCVGVLSCCTYYKPLKLQCMTVEMLTFKAYSFSTKYMAHYLKALQSQILYMENSL